MGTPANSWWDEMRQEAEGLPAPAPPKSSKAATIGGAAAAAVIAAGLGWWLTTAEPTTFQNRESARVQPAAAPAVLSPVDAEQVRRAHDEFLTTAQASGVEGLERFRESCEASARADGRILDFCLAFDLLSDGVSAPGPETQARRLALVEAAVPAEPAPASRVEAVRAQLQLLGALSAPPPAPSVATAQVQAAPAPVKVAAVAKPPVAKATAPAPPSRCRFLSTPADRMICANPSLKTQHDRMRAAYDEALKNGANPLAIDRGQAEWRALRNAADSRAELAALYARRTRELKAAAEEARLTPPN